MRRHALPSRGLPYRVPLLLLATALLMLAATTDAIRPAPSDVKPGRMQGEATAASHEQGGGGGGGGGEKMKAEFMEEEARATGSSLPDCSHACGACSPCSRVMVSFKCSIAEPCPMVYRCMCKGKCYPVPSS